MKKIKFKQLVLAAAMAAVLTASTAFAAQPEENITEEELLIDSSVSEKGEQSLPDEEQLGMLEEKQNGSIQIQLTEGKSGTKREGIKIYCKKVADVINGAYVLEELYQDSGIDFNAIENSQSLKYAAEKLSGYGKEESKAGLTDKNGMVNFKELPVGVYLIFAENHPAYDVIEPSLIAIPTWNETEGMMLYDITVVPKHTPRPEEGDNEAPQTSLQDDTRKNLMLAGGFFCAAGVMFLISRKRKGKHEI